MLRFIQKRLVYKATAISINDKRFRALLADSFLKKMIGLMFRPRLGNDTVMLFSFGRSARHGIWMRNMRFSIDAIWLYDSLKISDITRGIPPSPPGRVYRPCVPSSYLIEANCGFAGRNKLKKGDKAKIGLKK